MDSDVKKRYADVLAIFNLGKISWKLEDWFYRQRETYCYIYADDGDTVLLEDACGDPLKEIDLIDLRDALLEEMERCEDHYSDSLWVLVNGVLQMLLLKYGFKHDRIVCLHYGC